MKHYIVAINNLRINMVITNSKEDNCRVKIICAGLGVSFVI